MEFKTPEINEIKKPEPEGFKEIKPENGMNSEKAKEFWNDKFENSEDKTQKIECSNEHLAGKEHPKTGVTFEKKIINVDGEKKEVVVPIFKSEYDVKLPDDKLKASDKEQFEICNNDLRKEIETNKELRDKFDEEQLDQIMNGETPDGYTWHHDAEVGKMQLVDTETHQKTGHTGGRKIWGGGTENR